MQRPLCTQYYFLHCILCIIFYPLYSLHCKICIEFFALNPLYCILFITALVGTTGRDQHMAIFLLLLLLLLHFQPSNGPIRAKQITPWSTVIGRCGSMGLYSMGSHWSQSTWARLADRFYSTRVHFRCTQISLFLAWVSLVEISKCEETPF